MCFLTRWNGHSRTNNFIRNIQAYISYGMYLSKKYYFDLFNYYLLAYYLHSHVWITITKITYVILTLNAIGSLNDLSQTVSTVKNVWMILLLQPLRPMESQEKRTLLKDVFYRHNQYLNKEFVLKFCSICLMAQKPLK